MPYIGNPSAQRFISPRAASVFSGDGSTVAFTLEEAVTTDEDILVSVDGVIQEPSVAYAVSSGTTLTFTAAPSSNSGNNIFVYYIARTFGSISMPDGQNVNAAVGSFSGTLTTTGAFTSIGIDDNADATAITIDSSEHVGIGITSPDGTLHVHSATAGSVTANTDADDLVVENSSHAGINILSPDANRSAIQFGHTSDNLKLQIRHDGNTSLSQIISDDALTFNVGDGTERMRIDANGHITKPTQPAFLARVGSDSNNFAEGTNVTIPFATEVFDQNADYNNSNYTFTAPVTVKYQINVILRLSTLDSAAAYYYLELNTSNEAYYNIFDPDFGQDAVFWTINTGILADMDASDTVTARIFQETSGTVQTDIHADSFFSAYLVC